MCIFSVIFKNENIPKTGIFKSVFMFCLKKLSKTIKKPYYSNLIFKNEYIHFVQNVEHFFISFKSYQFNTFLYNFITFLPPFYVLYEILFIFLYCFVQYNHIQILCKTPPIFYIYIHFLFSFYTFPFSKSV